MVRQDISWSASERILQRDGRRTAFTLMEMLVVVAIIVALAGMGGFYFIGQLNESKNSAAKVQAKVVLNAAETFFINNGRYPNPLTELTVKDSEGRPAILKTPEAIKTPWNTDYTLEISGEYPVITYTRPDGKAEHVYK